MGVLDRLVSLTLPLVPKPLVGYFSRKYIAGSAMDDAFRTVRELLDEVVADIYEIEAEGEGPVAQLLDLMYYGDFVSLYLARQVGLDPGPVPVIDELKARLAT